MEGGYNALAVAGGSVGCGVSGGDAAATYDTADTELQAMHSCRFAVVSRRSGGAGPACCPPSSSAGPSFPSSAALLRVVGSARMLGALGLRPMHGAGGIGQGQWRGCVRPTGMERRSLLSDCDGAAAGTASCQARTPSAALHVHSSYMRTHARKKTPRPRFARPRRLKDGLKGRIIRQTPHLGAGSRFPDVLMHAYAVPRWPSDRPSGHAASDPTGVSEAPAHRCGAG